MGLDMYMRGRKFPCYGSERKEDGYKISAIEIELGYWRKHPNLHGYIVQAFGGGVDECQEIELDANALDQIATTIIEKRLPNTQGFFFGTSDTSEQARKYDLSIIEKARAWLEQVPHTEALTPITEVGPFAMYEVNLPPENQKDYRSVYYQASW